MVVWLWQSQVSFEIPNPFSFSVTLQFPTLVPTFFAEAFRVSLPSFQSPHILFFSSLFYPSPPSFTYTHYPHYLLLLALHLSPSSGMSSNGTECPPYPGFLGPISLKRMPKRMPKTLTPCQMHLPFTHLPSPASRFSVQASLTFSGSVSSSCFSAAPPPFPTSSPTISA